MNARTRERRFRITILAVLTLAFSWVGTVGTGAGAAGGGLIAFVSQPVGTLNDEVFVVGADGRGRRRLTRSKGLDTQPAWSPDGRRLVFVSERNRSSEIYVMNADGSRQQRLTRNVQLDNKPAWSPDGKRIAFVSERDGNPEIYVMNPDGNDQQRLTQQSGSDDDHAGHQMARDSSSGASWMPDGPSRS